MIDIAIGVDIGGTNTALGVVGRDGRCLVESSLSTNSFETPDDFVRSLWREIETCISKSGNVSLRGIGIGAPNGNYYSGTIEFAPNLRWKGIVRMVELVKKYTAVPVVLTNDANAAAIGEMIYGGARGMRDFIVVTLGTGLGSGIVVNGELVYGHDGFAGEIGHTIVDPNGRQCGCGRRGCLETYASASGIRRTLVELLGETVLPSSLRSVSFDAITAALIADAAQAGDALALEAFERTGQVLGLKLADAVAHTSPQAIFLFGGLANAGDLIFNPTRHYMEANMLNIFKNKVSLLPSGLHDNAAILGASALVWKHIEIS